MLSGILQMICMTAPIPSSIGCHQVLQVSFFAEVIDSMHEHTPSKVIDDPWSSFLELKMLLLQPDGALLQHFCITESEIAKCHVASADVYINKGEWVACKGEQVGGKVPHCSEDFP